MMMASRLSASRVLSLESMRGNAPEMKANARMRICRERKRNGLRVARVEYPDALPLALSDAGFLGAWDTENPQAVARAIEAALRAMVISAGYDVTGAGDDVV